MGRISSQGVTGKRILALAAVLAVSGLAGCSSHSAGGGGTQPPAMTVAFQSPPPTSILVGSVPVPFTAVVTNDTAGRGVDWLLTCTAGGDCGTLAPLHTDSGAPASYTPPSNVSGSNITVNVVAFAASNHSSNVPASFNVVGFNGSLSGTYVFEIIGGGAAVAQCVGAFVADGSGGISGGEVNCFSSTPDSILSTIDSGGQSNYQVGPDGTGSVNLATGASGTLTLGIVVLSNKHGLISQSQPFTGAGTMDLQTSVTLPTGGFAFVTNGQFGNDPNLYFQPVSTGGVFNINQNGTISGIGDQNLNGTVTRGFALAGSASQPDSMGMMTLCIMACSSAAPLQFSGYLLDSQHMKLASFTDPNTGLGLVASGTVIGQGSSAGSFTTNSALSGSYVYGILGQSQIIADPNLPGPGPAFWASAAWAGVFTSDGAGHLTNGSADQEVGFGVPPIADTLTGSYAVDPSGIGRVTATTNFAAAGPGPSFVFYLTGNGGPALALETDQAPGGGVASGGVGGGIGYSQAAATPSFNAAYGLGLTANNFGTETDISAQINVDSASGALAGSVTFGGAQTGTVNGTFTSSASGRFPALVNVLDGGGNTISASQGAFYVADPSQGFFIENDGVQVSLGYFSVQSPLQ